MDAWLRRLTPVLLLGLGLLVWGDALAGDRLLGERASRGFVAFAVGILCLYVALGVVERQRLQAAFKDVLATFRRYAEERRREQGSNAGPSGRPADEVQREAVQILIGALAAADLRVRQSSLQNLRRLTGQDFGEDASAWRRWLDSDGGAGMGGGQAGGGIGERA